MPRVLVVDDDDTIRDTLYELLSEAYVCQTAATAEKALARLEGDVYDVVLTDISMPGLSGVELLGHIRQRFSDTPVIIISGIDDREHAEGLIKLGAFDFLMKPFTLEGVEESVKRAVEYRRRLLKSRAAHEATDGKQDQGSKGDWTIVKEDSR
ncbi:MAG TPA: response regulator [Pyrinomonadaceae bacterium]|jgi:two-component system response regulator PilR (NtrC family)